MKVLFIQTFLCMLFFLITLKIIAQKEYHKEYYNNGQLKEEGWLNNNLKVDYWKFYYKNGSLQKEGHFENDKQNEYWIFYSENTVKIKEGHFIDGSMTEWWTYYNELGLVDNKCQLIEDKKNGFCLIYKNEQLIKAEKYVQGEKVEEWDTISSFKKDNSSIKLW